MFVGTRGDSVYAVRYAAGRATQVFTVASHPNMPHGVAFRDGALYVAEVSRILRFDDIESRPDNPPRRRALTTVLARQRAAAKAIVFKAATQRVASGMPIAGGR